MPEMDEKRDLKKFIESFTKDERFVNAMKEMETWKKDIKKYPLFKQFVAFYELLDEDMQQLVIIGLGLFQVGYMGTMMVEAEKQGVGVCLLCKKEFEGWRIPDEYWQRIPKKLWGAHICYPCYLNVVRE